MLGLKKTNGLDGSLGGRLRLAQVFASATLVVAAFSILSGMVANTFRPTSATGNVDSEVRIGVWRELAGSISITATNDAPCVNYDELTSTIDISSTRGAISSDCITYLVNTTDNNGYTLNIHTTSATGNLVGGTGEIVSPTPSTISNPAIFAGQTTGSAWGFGIPRGLLNGGQPDDPNGVNINFNNSYSVLGATNQDNTERFARVPTSPVNFSRTAIANAVVSDVIQDDVYNIFFGVAVGTAAPLATYVGEVVISGMVNSAPIPPQNIQTITVNNCPTNRTLVQDARDGNTYWVRKIGSLCWMETNLAYAGGGTNTYGDVMSAITLGNPDSGNNTAAPRYYNPAGSNVTGGTATPSTSTDGGATNPQYGYLYNWCAAMGGQSAACQVAAATQPNQDANSSGVVNNVCPANWRLPTANDLVSANNNYNAASTTSPTGLFTNGSFMFSGYWGAGSFGALGSQGRYWSSTTDIILTANATALSFSASNVNTATSSEKGSGAAVRCVAGNIAVTPDPIPSIPPTPSPGRGGGMAGAPAGPEGGSSGSSAAPPLGEERDREEAKQDDDSNPILFGAGIAVGVAALTVLGVVIGKRYGKARKLRVIGKKKSDE